MQFVIIVLQFGGTPLHQAARCVRHSVMATPHNSLCCDEMISYHLFALIRFGSTAVLKKLIEHGAIVDAQDKV